MHCSIIYVYISGTHSFECVALILFVQISRSKTGKVKSGEHTGCLIGRVSNLLISENATCLSTSKITMGYRHPTIVDEIV